jgi:hypothetical protein
MAKIAGNRTQFAKYRTNTAGFTAKWAGSDSNQRPPPCQGGILTRLDHRPQ